MLKQRNIGLSIHTPDGTKQCELYDSLCQFEGQAGNLQIVYDEDELYTMTFDVPRRITDENGDLIENYRWGFCRNEYLVYYTEDGVTDVYTIKSTEEADRGGVESGKVSCIHRSEQLKAKGYAVSMESQVGETSELASAILKGSGWSLGTVDHFYEEDLFDKFIETTGGLMNTPSPISFGAYMEIADASGASSWNATNGWQNAGIHIETHGKNLCDGLIEKGHLNADDGTPEYSTQTNAYRTINYVEIAAFAGQKLTLSGTNVGGAEWHFFNGARTQLSTATGLTATLPAGTKYIKYELWKDATGSANYATPPTNVQLELGQTATTYEDYVVPYTIDVPVIGQYDTVTRNHIYRYTVYDDTNHTVSQSETLLADEPLDAYTARLYEGGTVYVSNSGVGNLSVVLNYTVSDPEGATPREKVRTLSKDAGTSAYDALVDLADLMGAKLSFDGYNKRVNIVQRIGVESNVSFNISYNMKAISRVRSSNEMVSRCYIGDMDGVTITSVNPMGTNYLLDFSYARQAGLITPSQEQAITDFESGITAINENLMDYLDLQFETTNKINSLIGSTPFGTAKVASFNASAGTMVLSDLLYYEGGNVPTTDSTMYVRMGTGVWTLVTVSAYNAGSKTLTVEGTLNAPDNVCWYTGALPGTIGARIIAIKSKNETYDLAKTRYDAATDATERATYSEAMAEAVAELKNLSEGTATMAGLSQMYAELNALIEALNLVNSQIDAANAASTNLNEQFEDAMGDLLRDGMYDEGEYIDGQELALYTDVKEYLAKQALPQVEYSVDVLDRGVLEEYEIEKVHFGDGAYVTDPQMGIENLPVTVVHYVDEPMKGRCNTLNIGNFDRNGDDLFQSIIDAAKTVQTRQKVIERAVTLTPQGLIDPELIRQSIEAIGEPETDDPEEEIDVTKIENFESAVSQVVQDNLLTGALNAANIDWSKIDDLVLSVNSLVITATNKIKVGAVNLLKGTQDWSGATLYSGATVSGTYENCSILNNSYTPGGTPSYIDLARWSGLTFPGGGTVMVSFWAKGSGTIRVQVTNSGMISSAETSKGGSLYGSYGETDVPISSSWERIWVRWTVNSGTWTDKQLLFRQITYASNVQLAGVQMENGTTATDWSPSPEDTEDAIDQLTATLSLVPGEITAAVTGIVIGGTNLLHDSKWITRGSGVNAWRYGNGTSRYINTGDDFARLRITASDKTSDTWYTVYSPLFVLNNDWIGRKLTFSGWLYSEDWTAVDRGVAISLNLSTGGEAREVWRDKYSIVVPGQVQWGADANYDTPLANGEWLRFSTTFDLPASGGWSGSDTSAATIASMTHAFATIFLRRNGDIRLYKPKMEWGDKATDWAPAPQDVTVPLSGMDNLYYTGDSVSGYLTNVGSIMDNANSWEETTSDYIAVTPGETLTFQCWVTPETGSSNYLWMAYGFFNSSKTWLSSPGRVAETQGANTGTFQHRTITFTVPAGAAYIRISGRMYADGKMKLERNAAPTAYQDAVAEVVNNSITINKKGVFIYSTGTFQLDAENPNQDAHINIRGLLSLDNSGGLTAEQGAFAKSLTLGGQRVLTAADLGYTIKVATSKPSGHRFLWFQPSSVTQASYTGYTANSRDNTVRFGATNPITRSFTAQDSSVLANSSFTYTLEFDAYCLSDTQITGVRFSAKATKGTASVSFSQSAAISMTKYELQHITLTATSNTNLCTNANAISVEITGAASNLTYLFLQSQQYMTLTISSAAGGNQQACNVYYIP